MFVQDIITENYIMNIVSLLTLPMLASLLSSQELSPGLFPHIRGHVTPQSGLTITYTLFSSLSEVHFRGFPEDLGLLSVS